MSWIGVQDGSERRTRRRAPARPCSSTPKKRPPHCSASTARRYALSPSQARPRWSRFDSPDTSVSTVASTCSASPGWRSRRQNHGSIEAYETAKGRRYRVLYRRPDKKQTQKRGFTTKKAAELFLATTEVNIAQGRYLDPSLARVSVADWLQTWLAARGDLRATTRSRVESIIDKHITPELGSIPIGNLTRLRVQEWASAPPGAPATVRKIVNVLSGALRFAVEDERLPSNPAARLKLPKPTKTRKRYLSHDQVAALAQTIDEMKDGRAYGYGLVVLTLAYCGLRWGELSGLRICYSDLDGEAPAPYRRADRRRRQGIPAHRAAEGLRASEHPDPRVSRPPAPRKHPRTRRRRSRVLRHPHRHLASQPRLPGWLVRHRRNRNRPQRTHTPRTTAHRRITRGQRRGERQGGAADARARLGRCHARRVRRPVR